MSSGNNSRDPAALNNDTFLAKLAICLDRFIHLTARMFCWCYALLIGAILTNVVLRYGFSNGLIVFEEIQWHLYALGMMFGLSFAEITNSQVRVDIVADKLKRQTVRKWEIFGAIFFVLPFIFVVVFNSIDYVANSYRVNEASNSPLGLPYRWAIKAVIPISFIMLAIAVFSRLLHNIDALITKKDA